MPAHVNPHTSYSQNNTVQVNELHPPCDRCDSLGEFVTAGEVSIDGKHVLATYRCRRNHEQTINVKLKD